MILSVGSTPCDAARHTEHPLPAPAVGIRGAVLKGAGVARQKRGWALATCVAIVRPPLMLLTRRDWKGGHHLPPTGGCIVVANHISHADPFVFSHFVYDSGRLPRYLAKADVFAVPVGGRLLARAGQIPVYRQTRGASHAFGAAVEAVDSGQCVIVYPEGTITRDPGLWPMVGKTGAARIALATGVPVIPVAQWGAQDILSPYAHKLDLFPRKTIHVRAGEPVALEDLRRRPVTSSTLHTATERIMADITGLLETIRGTAAPRSRFNPREHSMPRIGNPYERATHHNHGGEP